MSHVLGYTVANDVSARRWQGKKGGGQWARAKSFDTFCPIGSELIVDIENPNEGQGLELKTVLNGEVMQHSSTSDMIYSVAEIVSFLSQSTTLLPGTIILTGTPEGVGYVVVSVCVLLLLLERILKYLTFHIQVHKRSPRDFKTR